MESNGYKPPEISTEPPRQIFGQFEELISQAPPPIYYSSPTESPPRSEPLVITTKRSTQPPRQVTTEPPRTEFGRLENSFQDPKSFTETFGRFEETTFPKKLPLFNSVPKEIPQIESGYQTLKIPSESPPRLEIWEIPTESPPRLEVGHLESGYKTPKNIPLPPIPTEPPPPRLKIGYFESQKIRYNPYPTLPKTGQNKYPRLPPRKSFSQFDETTPNTRNPYIVRKFIRKVRVTTPQSIDETTPKPPKSLPTTPTPAYSTNLPYRDLYTRLKKSTKYSIPFVNETVSVVTSISVDYGATTVSPVNETMSTSPATTPAPSPSPDTTPTPSPSPTPSLTKHNKPINSYVRFEDEALRPTPLPRKKRKNDSYSSEEVLKKLPISPK